MESIHLTKDGPTLTRKTGQWEFGIERFAARKMQESGDGVLYVKTRDGRQFTCSFADALRNLRTSYNEAAGGSCFYLPLEAMQEETCA